MLKKTVLVTLFIGLIGVLVAGAAMRTMDRTALVAEAEGRDRGSDEASEHAEGESGQGRGSQGQGNAGYDVAERKYPNYDGSPPEEWLVHEGTVVLAPEDGVDLVIEMSDGKKLTVGTGPMYMASQGFILQAGEPVQVLGYWEDHEFKAAQLTRLTDGQTITLRDELGRPAWAGAGRNAQNNNQSSYGGQGRADAPGDQAGVGEAEASGLGQDSGGLQQPRRDGV